MNAIRNLLFTAGLLLTPLMAYATVTLPAIDIQNFTSQGDNGATYVGGVSLDVDSTAFAIVYGGGNSDLLPLTDFQINDLAGTAGTAASFNNGFYEGSISIGSLFSAQFVNMTTSKPVTVLGVTSQNFEADLFNIGGSLGGPTARIEGVFRSNNTFTAKVGPVVPVPAAIWLFTSGLLGLVALSRRKA